MTELFAQPYDIAAPGFYFKTPEAYQEKAAANKNDSLGPSMYATKPRLT